jgi:hypothetical protein
MGKSVLKVIADVITNAFTWALALVATAALFLIQGISEGSAVAYVILGGVIFMLVAGLGAIFVLLVQWISEGREARRDRREQERFRVNAQENLSIMAAMQRVQNAQNTMLLKQAQRALPGSGDVVDIDALVADDSVFEELEG